MLRQSSPLALGDLDMAVLEVLWGLEEGDVYAVVAALPDAKPHNTVQSALERLHRKGLLSRRKQSHAFLYRPHLSKEELAARLVEEAVQRVKGTAPLPLLAAFVDLAVTYDKGVLDELEQLVALHRAKRKG